MTPKFCGIVAMNDKSRGIAYKDQIPWSIKEDLDYYIRVITTTTDKNERNAIIFGTKSWDTLPENQKPINPCLNIILTKTRKIEDIKIKNEENKSNIKICHSLNEAIQFINDKYKDEIETIYALGGINVYKDAINYDTFERFYITRVFGNFNCDRFIEPEDFLNKFKKVKSENLNNEEKLYEIEYNKIKIDPNNKIKYIFEVYDKIK